MIEAINEVETAVTVPEEQPFVNATLNGMMTGPARFAPPLWMWAAVGALILKTQRLNATVPADWSIVKSPMPRPCGSATLGASLAPVRIARKLATCPDAAAAKKTSAIKR